MELNWENGFEITVETNDCGEVVISANAAGLRSLAGHLMALAEEDPGAHIHLDPYNSLEEGSSELILVKAE